MRIIVVDDTAEDLALADRVLRQCKLVNPISLFKGGKECIDYFESKTSDPASPPETSIIFLDLTMPETSGLDVLQFLKDHEYARHCIPVMLSGLKDVKAINQGYQFGAKTFLLKPITPDDLLQFLNSLPEKITIEEVEKGYTLHWNERIDSDTTITRRVSRITTLSA